MSIESIHRDGARILLCDDSADQREMLSILLTRRGYDVDEAADGAAALLMLKRRNYDLVLLDLQMPQADGFDVLAWIQNNRPQLSVLVLSGLPPEEIGEGLDRLPQHELPPLLMKPVDIGQLTDLIELKLAGELP
jgi:CheY-like chemotaxis protein